MGKLIRIEDYKKKKQKLSEYDKTLDGLMRMLDEQGVRIIELKEGMVVTDGKQQKERL